MEKRYVYTDGTNFAKINQKTFVASKTKDINKASLFRDKRSAKSWRTLITDMEMREVNVRYVVELN
jgi:hypothetical protein